MSSNIDEVDIASINSDISRFSPAVAEQPEHQNSLKIMRTISNIRQQEQADHNNLERLISNNAGVSRVVTRLEERAGALGPLEVPLDLEKPATKHSIIEDYNPTEQDEWQYPIDQETGLRLVEFLEGDNDDPRNISDSKKWYYTIVLGLVCFTVAFGSAVVTGDIAGPAKEFNVSVEVVILTVTLFVLGFGFGPLVFAPLSEELGRYPIYGVTLFLAVIFVIPCALAKNIGTLLVCRLIDGLAFSAPMCLIGGSLADIWPAEKRGVAMAIFSAAPFMGPIIGPLVGGFIGDNTSWRWIYWTLLIFSGVIYVIFMTSVPETHHATILKKRAKKLRRVTGDDRYRSLTELKIRNIAETAKVSLLRPFLLLSELIVFLITIYMSVIYGLLYMFFFAYPVVYGDKGWSDSKIGLMFIPILVGVFIATSFAPWINRDYNRRAQPYRDRGEMPPPELRLIPMMIGCWFVPVSLFCFAWTSYEWVHWAGPCISGLGAGIGFAVLYNPANNYIVDSYQHYAASALAAKTFVRSIWGACCPLFTIQMYHRLGNEWATSLMAFISLACCMIPFLFYRYGAVIREKSKYAYAPESGEAKTDDAEKHLNSSRSSVSE
ncbi:hypothetical protein BABINDRAFT_159588 [Babjeviella inositovora NRRL Y-12698]|uniref:Major facilitator superfamily (MFS) profile domain-containing protein n=1 Tax=Babjeviella inositovora NRRL Y-12698 TaxID=984486 RepID=A0A1E3R167_9ASCO|nr:uncharacterized protein BABINDRAFT_159588 [Babjeviella inositovora NRRL Y-12698]ODQ83137.1 hypothetical protein BABINDRAFT_159588 [Babjeviella inositovora NRRL Y-12698]